MNGEKTENGGSDTGEAGVSPGRLVPAEGWHVLHLFYHIDQSQWQVLSVEEQLEAKTNLSRLIQEIRSHPETQLLIFSVVTPKADMALMLLTPCLHDANTFEKQITGSLGPGVLVPSYSYLSLTERSEYTTTEEEYGAGLVARGTAEGTPEFEVEMEKFRIHMKKYLSDRLYPNMPDWPVFCFYNMNKRRGEQVNWYDLDFAARKELMQGHARIGRGWAGKIRQLITGSTGLDDAEWGVTLFAHDTIDVKGIVYEMRFDPVSSRYADFGEFYIGVQLPLDELFRRVAL